MSRPVWQIAAEIRKDWTRVNYAAVPYLDAMSALESPSDRYIMDRGDDIIRYFLSNATSWHGDVARRVKAELKDMIKDMR